MSEATFYERAGGSATFKELTKRFYQRVSVDPILKPMYPEEDLGPAALRLQMFLEQYWGGPATYQEQRGHPRLRMRHMPFVIDDDARDRWIYHMHASLFQIPMDEKLREQLWTYLVSAAHSLVNTP